MDDIEQLPDGVYLGLPDRDYFGQKDRRGSSDWIDLDKFGLGWWWKSDYNPRHKAPVIPERTYGSALHALFLESVDAYEARFAVQPDKAQFEGLVDTAKEIEVCLAQHEVSLQRKPKDKAEWNLVMRMHLPQVPCWDNIIEEFREGLLDGVEVVTAEEDEMLRLMRSMALEHERADNVEIRKLFAENADRPPLAEVSIFSTDRWGIKRRRRIDRMFPRFDLDLKSLGGWQGRPLPWEVGELIARNRWFIQRADYLEGRQDAYRLITEGKLHGGTVDQRKWLATWPEKHPLWDWVWLAYQKPDSVKGRAPVLMPVWDDSFNPAEPGASQDSDCPPGKRAAELLRAGRARMRRAINLYRGALEEFGFDRPWGRVETLHHTDETEPRVYVPHYVAAEEPEEEGAYG